MKAIKTLYYIIIILAAFIVIFIFLNFCDQTSENKIKSDIKRKLYILNVDYRDEYVDLWYDIMNSPNGDMLVYPYPFIEPETENLTLLKYKKEAQNIINSCNKLIEIYGAEFITIFPQNPLYKPYKDENNELIWVNNNTLIALKQRCEHFIKNIDRILEIREKEKQEKEELEKIVYGKD